MENKLCATTGHVDDRDDVLHLRDLDKFSELSGTRAGPVVAHNGHDNLVQEQHLGDRHCAYLLFSARELQELVAA